MDLFYYETGSNTTYILIDGMLRYISESAFYNFFDNRITPSSYIHFNLAAAPYTVGTPLPDNAKLVRENNIIFIEDAYPWDMTKTVLRPVLTQYHLKKLCINWQFVKHIPANPVYGVPLSIHKDENIKAARLLAELKEMYNHIVSGAALNPYFYYLLSYYPAEEKENYKSELEGKIIKAEHTLNKLLSPVAVTV